MFTASDLRKGLKIELDGEPYVVTEFQFCKPGKGQALYRCKLRNMLTGASMDKTFRSVDKIDKPDLEERELLFSYEDGDALVFLDADTYEQVSIPASLLGDKRYLLADDMACSVLFYRDRPIDISLPFSVEKRIAKTDPGVRGDTATNVTKPAWLDNGYELQVPLFINEGDVIKIDIRTGTYAERVRKA
ncbi:MAG: elongation factor P [Kiritimatiellaeota bacterium]|nr:elongation factor P [Kiritimatiellota bacterium]